MQTDTMNSQLPSGVSMAQSAKQLDALAKNLQTALFRAPLQKELANTGITIEGDSTLYGISVKAHCLELRGDYQHVWLTKGDGHRELGGRILFRRVIHDHLPCAEAVYQITFDAIGNAQFGRLGSNGPTFNIRSDSDAFEDAKRRLAMDLLAIFHLTMESVPL